MFSQITHSTILIHHSLYYQTIQKVLGECFLNAVTMGAEGICVLPESDVIYIHADCT